MRPTSLFCNCLLLLTVVLFASCGPSKKIHSADPGEKGENVSRGRMLDKNELREKYAALMQVSPRKIRNLRLYAFIENWYNTPYRYGGNSQSGVDCSGLVQQLYRNVYGRNITRQSASQYKESRRFRRKRRLDEGDLVFFTTTGKTISHVGVYLQNDYFVHASPRGVVLSNLQETYWKRCFRAGGKLD